MLLDAIVLAGGKSSRLSGVPKAALLWHGSTLLQNTIDVVLHAGVRRVVVVGPEMVGPDAPDPHTQRPATRPDARILFAREDPPFGGPAAAIAAGMRALGGHKDQSELVLVLACDMPRVADAVSQLAAALPLLGSRDGDGGRDGGNVASDGAAMLDASGMRQPLAAVYGRSALADAVDRLRASATLDGASMRWLISTLDLVELADDRESTLDVDTWNDAAAFGSSGQTTNSPTPHEKESIMSDDTTAKPPQPDPAKAEMLEVLERWSASLSAELDLVGIDVDIDRVLALAGVAAHAVLRPAAPLTTYLVGYAAGRAAALGEVNADEAAARAFDTASKLARRHTA